MLLEIDPYVTFVRAPRPCSLRLKRFRARGYCSDGFVEGLEKGTTNERYSFRRMQRCRRGLTRAAAASHSFLSV